MREAVALQDGIAYMEPPYWYYPVRQSLGAVLLERGRAEEAVEVFDAALAEVPRNGWALWGLAKRLRPRVIRGPRNCRRPSRTSGSAILPFSASIASDPPAARA